MRKLEEGELLTFLESTTTSDPPENYNGDVIDKRFEKELVDSGFMDRLGSACALAMVGGGIKGFIMSAWVTGLQMGRELEIRHIQNDQLDKMMK